MSGFLTDLQADDADNRVAIVGYGMGSSYIHPDGERKEVYQSNTYVLSSESDALAEAAWHNVKDLEEGDIDTWVSTVRGFGDYRSSSRRGNQQCFILPHTETDPCAERNQRGITIDESEQNDLAKMESVGQRRGSVAASRCVYCKAGRTKETFEEKNVQYAADERKSTGISFFMRFGLCCIYWNSAGSGGGIAVFWRGRKPYQ